MRRSTAFRLAPGNLLRRLANWHNVVRKCPDTNGEVQFVLKGLEVARDFFDNWGLPYLEKECSEVVGRAAVLVCGSLRRL